MSGGACNRAWLLHQGMRFREAEGRNVLPSSKKFDEELERKAGSFYRKTCEENSLCAAKDT